MDTKNYVKHLARLAEALDIEHSGEELNAYENFMKLTFSDEGDALKCEVIDCGGIVVEIRESEHEIGHFEQDCQFIRECIESAKTGYTERPTIERLTELYRMLGNPYSHKDRLEATKAIAKELKWSGPSRFNLLWQLEKRINAELELKNLPPRFAPHDWE